MMTARTRFALSVFASMTMSALSANLAMADCTPRTGGGFLYCGPGNPDRISSIAQNPIEITATNAVSWCVCNEAPDGGKIYGCL